MDDKFTMVNSNPKGVPEDWNRLLLTDNANLQVQLDKHMSVELDKEWQATNTDKESSQLVDAIETPTDDVQSNIMSKPELAVTQETTSGKTNFQLGEEEELQDVSQDQLV